MSSQVQPRPPPSARLARRSRLGRFEAMAVIYLVSLLGNGCSCNTGAGHDGSMSVTAPELVEIGQTATLQAQGTCFFTTSYVNRHRPKLMSLVGPDGAAVTFQQIPEATAPTHDPNVVTFVPRLPGKYQLQFKCSGEQVAIPGMPNGKADDKAVTIVAVAEIPSQVSAGPWIEAWRPGVPLRYDGAARSGPSSTSLLWTLAGCDGLSLTDETALKPILVAAGASSCSSVDLTLRATTLSGKVTTDSTRLTFTEGLGGPAVTFTPTATAYRAYDFVEGSLDLTSQASLERYSLTLIEPGGTERLVHGGSGSNAAGVERVRQALRFQLGEAGTTRLRTEVVTGHGTLVTSQELPPVGTSLPPGIVVSPPSGPTTAEGGSATYTVRLARPPNGLVFVKLSPDRTNAQPAVTAVVFTPENWNVDQTVVVKGLVQDADRSTNFHIYNQISPSDWKPGYDTSGYYLATISVGILFQHIPLAVPAIVVNRSGLLTSERADVVTLAVSLSRQPSAEVVLVADSSRAAEGIVSGAPLRFDSANWATPQPLVVTGVDDPVADGIQPYTVTVSVSMAGADYSGALAAVVQLANEDDDTAGLSLSPASGPTSEAGGQATFTVRLTSQPTGTVLLDVASSDVTEGTVAPAQLTFTAATWSTPQTVTATGADDGVVDGTQAYAVSLTVAAASTDASGYKALPLSSVPLTNQDNDAAGYQVSAISGPTTEAGGQATFTVKLTSAPNGLLVLDAASSVPAEGTAAPAILTFDAGNWSTPQTVTATGVDDQVDDGNQPYTVSLSVSPASTDTSGLTAVDPPDALLTNLDDDTAAYLVSAASGPTTEAGGTATFTVRLATQPSGAVVLGATSSTPSEGVASPATVTFTAANWSAPQVITVTGVDDQVADGPRAYTVQFSLDPTSTDGSGYRALLPGSVALTNLDDDVAALVVSAASGPTTEAGGTATFTARLATQPVGTVLLDVTSTDATEGAVSPAQLTFTAANWSAPQVVTVTGLDDQEIDGPQAYAARLAVSAGSTDGTGYLALAPATVPLTNLDNDTPLFEVSAASGPTTEAGGAATFTVRLGAQPNGTLIVDVASAVTAEGTASPLALTFDAATWATPQVVTVTGVDDLVDDGDQPYTVVLSINPASTDTSGLTAANPPDVLLTNLDDDTLGLQVSAASGPTSEAGGQATFTARLTSQPTGSVVLGVSSASPAEGTASPATLTFDAATWATPQTVTVTGVDDAVADGDQPYQVQLTALAASTDGSGYQALAPASVALVNQDDDVAALVVSAVSGPTSEAGGAATFTVRLATQPTGTVLVDAASSDATEGTAAPARLTFTAATWSAPQTVTVTGADDFTVDGPQAYDVAVSVAAASTDGSGYKALAPSSVALVNQDDDVVALVVSAPTGQTTEAGGQATFTVRLATQPTGAVVLDVASSDVSEGLSSPASLTFTAATWATPQVVTVTGADDGAVDGPQPYSVSLTVAAATADGSGYLALAPASVALVNQDDDSLGWVVSAPSGNTSEAGATASFTVKLGAQPKGLVVLDVASDLPAEGTASPATLTFDAATWATPQAVTVTGQDDLVDDGDQPYSVLLTAGAGTTDTTGLASIDPPDVNLVNQDDDTAGYQVSAASGPTTEAGGTASFTVRLTSQPTGSVILGVASSDTTEGTAAPASLTFTAGNWNAPQTVTVTGVDDAVDDGDQAYAVQLSFDPASTNASGYAALSPVIVALTSTDDDTAGYLISAVSDNTRETGTSATFTVRLTSAPAGTLLVDVTSADTSEGTVDRPQLGFTAANWSTPQTVTITGVDDALPDGNVPYTILLTRAAASTVGGAYATLDPADVSLLNIDDDGAGGEGQIAGFVMDFFRTKEINGAVVTVRGTHLSAVSETNFFAGIFVLNKVPVGPQVIDVTYPGFTSASVNVTVTAGATADAGIVYLSDPLPPGDLRISIADTPVVIAEVHAFAPNGDHLSNYGASTSTAMVLEGSSKWTNFRLSSTTQLPGDYVFKTWSGGVAACGEPLTFKVYDSTGLRQTIPVPTTGCSPDSAGWNAFRVNGSTVTLINTFTNVYPTDGSY